MLLGEFAVRWLQVIARYVSMNWLLLCSEGCSSVMLWRILHVVCSGFVGFNGFFLWFSCKCMILNFVVILLI